MTKVYLIAFISAKTLKIESVGLCGESPMEMTRMNTVIAAALMWCSGPSFAEAAVDLLACYKRFMPELAAKFPVPQIG